MTTRRARMRRCIALRRHRAPAAAAIAGRRSVKVAPLPGPSLATSIVAAVQLDDAPRQRQADAEPAAFALGPLLRLDRRARTRARRSRRPCRRRRRSPSARPRPRSASTRSAMRPPAAVCLHGVRDQVGHDLLDARAVGVHPGRARPRARSAGRPSMPAARERAQRLGHRGVQVDRLAVQRHLARNGAPDVEQVVDDSRQVQRLPRDDVLRELPVARCSAPSVAAGVRHWRSTRADCAARGRASRETRPSPGWSAATSAREAWIFAARAAARASTNDRSSVATSTNSVIVVTEPASQPLSTSGRAAHGLPRETAPRPSRHSACRRSRAPCRPRRTRDDSGASRIAAARRTRRRAPPTTRRSRSRTRWRPSSGS